VEVIGAWIDGLTPWPAGRQSTTTSLHCCATPAPTIGLR